jgi:predicted nuclease of restriction endonuclease-like RecB superfamily
MQEVDMPLLQVRECPEDIYRKISLVAKNENRTIAQQVVVLLEKSLGQRESNIERRKHLLEKIESRKIPNELKAIDAVALIREDRDR